MKLEIYGYTTKITTFSIITLFSDILKILSLNSENKLLKFKFHTIDLKQKIKHTN